MYFDVVSKLGEPILIRDGTDERMRNAVNSYGYWVAEHQFAYFFFGYENELRAISIFFAEMPQLRK